MVTIKTALISVFHKDRIGPLVSALHELGVELYSTGGTEEYISNLGIAVHKVETLTGYPSIFGGRVKTLHPKVFGGILSRRTTGDREEALEHAIPEMDLVVVDLYPFEQTVASGGSETEIIEKIDIGGISLIRAAAKNFKQVTVLPGVEHFERFAEHLKSQGAKTDLALRKRLAAEAFAISSRYDAAIHGYLAESDAPVLTDGKYRGLRYGENPHQEGRFYGDLDEAFEQLHGKELSYNNLLDIDAAVHLMDEFADADPSFGILKHNNACGFATRKELHSAYAEALAGDPVSAFGGVMIANREVDQATATEMDKVFFEVIIAPGFSAEALEILRRKKNRIILRKKEITWPTHKILTTLNGYLWQEKDGVTDRPADFRTVTDRPPTDEEVRDLEFAAILAKHTKSNTIVLAKDNRLIASGTGQTSRVDALKQALEKARNFEVDTRGAVMASDAFFPFPDCVEIAHEAGISAVIQPGGSVKDQLSIDYCNEKGMAMVFTGNRHFKH